MDSCKALQLVDSMTMDISGHRDDYRQALEAVIETNAEGRDLGFLRRKPGRVPHLVAPRQHVRDQRPVPHPTSRPCHASFATATFALRPALPGNQRVRVADSTDAGRQASSATLPSGAARSA
ncbi:hypothetical protein ACFRH4_24800 [Streptomyces mirabilis]|uniref:hypothetical protein n=1 Tax=Streptomyces mirabilis TaxID=68239 RepID=UPI0036AA675F